MLTELTYSLRSSFTWRYLSPGCLFQTSSTVSTPTTAGTPTFSNCREMLDERLQVLWEKHGEFVEVQLAGRIREDQYLAFGISGESGR